MEGAWCPCIGVVLLKSLPSVIIVMLVSSAIEGRMLSWKVVLDAHCHAMDSLVLERHVELCC